MKIILKNLCVFFTKALDIYEKQSYDLTKLIQGDADKLNFIEKGIFKMKKLLALLMVLCMAFSFVACAESEEEKAANALKDAIEEAADALEDLTL